MAILCKAITSCTKSAYLGAPGGPCTLCIIRKAGEPGSVAKMNYGAIVTHDANTGLPISMNLTIDGRKHDYMAKGGSTKNGIPDIPQEVVFEPLKGVLPDAKYQEFTSTFDKVVAATRARWKEKRKNEKARKSGIYIPNSKTRLCLYISSGCPFCVYHEINGCNGTSFYGIPGLPCLSCAISHSETEYDAESCELKIYFELVSDNLETSLCAGDIVQLSCKQVSSGVGFSYNGMNFTLPNKFGALLLSAIPADDLKDLNKRIILRKSLELRYKCLLDQSPGELLKLVDKIHAHRSNKLSSQVCLLLNCFISRCTIIHRISFPSGNGLEDKEVQRS